MSSLSSSPTTEATRWHAPLSSSSLSSPQLNSLLEKAVLMNNSSIDFLRRRKYFEALELLDCAYAILRLQHEFQLSSETKVNAFDQPSSSTCSPNRLDINKRTLHRIVLLHSFLQQKYHPDGPITVSGSMAPRHLNGATPFPIRNQAESTPVIDSQTGIRLPPRITSVEQDSSSIDHSYCNIEANHVSSIVPLQYETLLDLRLQSVSADISQTYRSEVSVPNDGDFIASPGNFFSLYNRAFILRRGSTQESNKTPTTTTTVEDTSNTTANNFVSSIASSSQNVPAVVLYNAGLTLHRMALNDGCSSTFEKALETYQLSDRLIRISLQVDHQSEIRKHDSQVLLLALANNMGHIYSHFFRYNDIGHCIEQMLGLFCISSCKVQLLQEEYIFFYMNILLVLGRYPVLAPAA